MVCQNELWRKEKAYAENEYSSFILHNDARISGRTWRNHFTVYPVQTNAANETSLDEYEKVGIVRALGGSLSSAWP